MNITMHQPAQPTWQVPRPTHRPTPCTLTDEPPPRDPLLVTVLDRVDYPLLLVDSDGLLLLSNRSGHRLLAVGGPLRLDGGRVLSHHALGQRSLQTALRAAAQGRRSLLALGAGGVGAPMLAVAPLDSRPEPNPAVLLMGSRGQACEPLSLDFFARAHGITKAEVGVLHALCEGLPPSDIARRAGVAVCTVRTQIASLRQKTSTRNVGELVRQVTRLPPIMGLLG